MKFLASVRWTGAALLAAAFSSPCLGQPAAVPIVSAEAVDARNAQAVANRPKDAEAPGRFSVDHPAHAVAYNLQAPGVAVVPLPNGRDRIWLSWYQQNNKPGGGAIGGGSTPHTVYAYCDDPFGAPDPVWRRAVYIDPVAVAGDETASDPEVALLPDGRLLCSYITSGPSRSRRRSSYAFLIQNPTATEGAFEVGRQQWLGYGVLSQAFVAEGAAYAVLDEWGAARRFSKLETSPAPQEDVSAVGASEIPWPGHPGLTIFFESSLHAVSGGRFRAYRRTKEGVYTTLSEVGGKAWGKEEKWTDHPSVNSRSAFARSPRSGRVVGAVNCPPGGVLYRTDLTLVSSAEEGAPGSFRQALNIEPDPGGRKVAAQYPRLAFDRSGWVYCVYRWSDSRPGAPHHGAAIMLARVREDALAAGTATLADVEKRAACVVAPSKKEGAGAKSK